MPSSVDTIASPLPLAMALAALAGAVDAIGIVLLGSLFVSFMSGNTTQLGTAVVALEGQDVARAAAVIAVFVCGVMAGEVLATRFAPKRRPSVLLALVALGLASAAVCSRTGAMFGVSLMLTFSMGLQNAVVRRAGGVDIALTYVTGTLVHFSRASAAALLGRGSWKKVVPFGALWLAFVVGAGIGGAASVAGPAAAIGAAAAAAAMMAVFTLGR